jgi:hypothetical protein
MTRKHARIEGERPGICFYKRNSFLQKEQFLQRTILEIKKNTHTHMHAAHAHAALTFFWREREKEKSLLWYCIHSY